MNKVILICGKICCGKTTYTNDYLKTHRAVSLSCDELMYELYNHNEGENFDIIADRVKKYLHRKAAQTVKAGADVILDWGFWKREEREETAEFYKEQGIDCEWHYIEVSDGQWQKNISLRNQAVNEGATTDYYVDGGLIEKLNRLFEAPERSEMDYWITK